MRRTLGLILAIVAIGVAPLAPAHASTLVAVSMSFTEQEFLPTCPLSDAYFCGRGIVLPYGNATENIHFEGGCGGECDLRTISLPQGSIVIEEPFNTALCPASCRPRGAGDPVSAVLSDTIVGGTGAFRGASGHLDGFITAAGNQSHVTLTGTIVMA
jgi:hypothetical protein